MSDIYNVRRLQTKDLYLIGSLIRKNLHKIRGINTKALPDEGEEARRQRVGQLFLEFLLDNCADEMWSWLASMVEMDVTEFGDQPISAVFDIIDQIKKTEDFADFFKRLSSMISGS